MAQGNAAAGILFLEPPGLIAICLEQRQQAFPEYAELFIAEFCQIAFQKPMRDIVFGTRLIESALVDKSPQKSGQSLSKLQFSSGTCPGRACSNVGMMLITSLLAS